MSGGNPTIGIMWQNCGVDSKNAIIDGFFTKQRFTLGVFSCIPRAALVNVSWDPGTVWLWLPCVGLYSETKVKCVRKWQSRHLAPCPALNVEGRHHFIFLTFNCFSSHWKTLALCFFFFFSFLILSSLHCRGPSRTSKPVHSWLPRFWACHPTSGWHTCACSLTS